MIHLQIISFKANIQTNQHEIDFLTKLPYCIEYK